MALRFKATFKMRSESVINVVTIDDEVGTILQRVFLPLIWRQGGE